MRQNQTLVETIHRGALADLQRIRAEEPPPRHRVLAYREWEARQADAADGVVPLNIAAWLGVERVDEGRSMSVSRAYRAGEKAGLWHRIVERGRTCGLLLVEGVSDD